ncbi:vp39 [Spodoptera frugiperda granulovirus]|uniref:Vp39 n=1 Tax=Spodoptera frugiperda granulovirus TaxID=307454 RepID=A0A0C5AUX0_9BBAC|nr:vp39 [Spodoptera frugiperda granulovirus]AJK91753.1 vp39 [Spodoptera frugiperda granulovirus]AXS01116.1 vp39 [Spodoptera frugiperda granulovirus]
MNYDQSIACLTGPYRNFCIFQGVQPPEAMNCGTFTPTCSRDSHNDDGTYICNAHLARYFKIKKQVLEIPSGVGNTSFRLLVGGSLIQQNAPEPSRITIPARENYYTYLNVANMTSMEKYVFYSIYDEPLIVSEPRNDPNQAPTGTRLIEGGYEGPIRALCSNLAAQEFYTEDVLRDLSSKVTFLMGAIQPSIICRPVREETVRTYGDENANNQAAFDAMPPFIKNLILRLVRPVNMLIGNEEFIIEQLPTCSIVPGKGVIPVKLYNPDKPRFNLNPYREPKFQVRAVIEFEGRATRAQQDALAGYERFVISRPLLLGREVIAQQ